MEDLVVAIRTKSPEDFVEIASSYISGQTVVLVYDDEILTLTGGQDRDLREVLECFRIYLYIRTREIIPHEYVNNYIALEDDFVPPENLYWYNIILGKGFRTTIFNAWNMNPFTTVNRIKKNYREIFKRILEIDFELEQQDHVKELYKFVNGEKVTSYEYFEKQVSIFPQEQVTTTDIDIIELQAGHLKLMNLLETDQKSYQEYVKKYSLFPEHYIRILAEKYGKNIKLIDPSFGVHLQNFVEIYSKNIGKLPNFPYSLTNEELEELGKQLGINMFFDAVTEKDPNFDQYKTTLDNVKIMSLPDSPQKLKQMLRVHTFSSLPDNYNDVLNSLIRKYSDEIVLGEDLNFQGVNYAYTFTNLDEDNFVKLFPRANIDVVSLIKIFYPKLVTGTTSDVPMKTYLSTVKKYVKKYYKDKIGKVSNYYLDLIKDNFKDILKLPIKVYDRVQPKNRNNKFVAYLFSSYRYNSRNIVRVCALKVPTSFGDKYIVKHIWSNKEKEDNQQKIYLPEGIYYDLDLEMYLPKKFYIVDVDGYIKQTKEEILRDIANYEQMKEPLNEYEFMDLESKRIRLAALSEPTQDVYEELAEEILDRHYY